MKRQGWKKETIYNNKTEHRYELKKNGFVIDVDITPNKQGYPASNQVNVFAPRWGGWVLNTPKNFRTIKGVNKFVRNAKSRLDKGMLGRKVAFPRED